MRWEGIAPLKRSSRARSKPPRRRSHRCSSAPRGSIPAGSSPSMRRRRSRWMRSQPMPSAANATAHSPSRAGSSPAAPPARALSPGRPRPSSPPGRSWVAGAADVVVCDGFTGNVVLKALEGTIATVLGSLREEISASRRAKLGGLLIRPAARGLRDRLDPDTYGGAYLLGLRGLAVIAHGSSGRRAIANAIRLAARGVEHDVLGSILEQAEKGGVEFARPC